MPDTVAVAKLVIASEQNHRYSVDFMRRCPRHPYPRIPPAIREAAPAPARPMAKVRRQLYVIRASTDNVEHGKPATLDRTHCRVKI
jgi:hypothetical protein